MAQKLISIIENILKNNLTKQIEPLTIYELIKTFNQNKQKSL